MKFYDRSVAASPDHLTLSDAAQNYFRCSVPTLRRAIARGDVRVLRFGPHVRVSVSEVERVRAATAEAARAPEAVS